MSLPDGLYDKLLDDVLLAEIKTLVESDQASVGRLSASERSTRLAEAVGRLVAGVLNDVEPDENGAPLEQAQLALAACRTFQS